MMTSTETMSMSRGNGFSNAGAWLLRYGLAIVLIWVGVLKFTAYEAMGIKPLVENSPFLSWAYGVTSVEGFSKFLGAVEIITGLLIASRPFSAKISAVGSIISCIIFLITLTFLFTTPGVWQPEYGFPYLSPMPGQFVAKDLLFFGASLWTAGEAMSASKMMMKKAF